MSNAEQSAAAGDIGALLRAAKTATAETTSSSTTTETTSTTDTTTASSTADTSTSTSTADTSTSTSTSSTTTTTTSVKQVVRFNRERPVRKTREERQAEQLDDALNTYATARNGSTSKIRALADVVHLIQRNPKSSNLDKVYKFFVQHRNDDCISPENALQRNAILDKDTNIRVRLFWRVMYGLVKGTTTRNRISLEMLRTVFRNDDFVNWVAAKMNQLSRSSRKSS